MRKNAWAMEIIHKDNGYLIHEADGGEIIEEDVIQDSESDDLKSAEELLWEVIEHFCLGGSRHDKERLVIKREPGDKYEGKKGTVYKGTWREA